MLSFEEARQKVITVVRERGARTAHDVVEIGRGFGRILAEPILADRDYPPFDRSTRDGFAVRSADVEKPGAQLELIGEIKAGDTYAVTVAPGQCVQIMTGAALPLGTDAVMMIEHTRQEGKRVFFESAAEPGQNVVPRGSEASEDQTLLEPGARMGYAELALAAQVGKIRFDVFRRPRVAILSTGDEVVSMETQPGPFQIRNSNGLSLAVQAALAGAAFDLVLIDLMRLKQSRLARWRIKDLAQLLFSSDLPGITRTDRLRFFKKYLGIRRLDGDARWLLRRIQWKASLYHRHNAILARKAAA